MAFLDNSGDIILDAVITDTGRKRLAEGNGSFNIQSFCLGDDEIDYSLYNRNHTSGSSYYDLEIMQTPILEAFTDNRASLHHRLMTITDREILHMPVLRLNEEYDDFKRMQSALTFNAPGMFGIVVDQTTGDRDPQTGPVTTGLRNEIGILDGESPKNSNAKIVIDQGTLGTNSTGQLNDQLIDPIYLIEIDGRLGSIVGHQDTDDGNLTTIAESFVDDDQIATYMVSQTTPGSMIMLLGENMLSPIDGERGTRLRFKIKANRDLANTNRLFETIGKLEYSSIGTFDFYVIDSVVRITGLQTGQRIDIPVRFLKIKL